MDPAFKHDAEAAPPPSDGIARAVGDALSSMRRVLSDLFRLFSLEVRRAGLTLVWMVALGAMTALLVVTAWLGLMGAMALWAVSYGATWVSALVAIALANLLAAAAGLFFCVAMSRSLLFPATRRQLAVAPTRPEAA